MEVRGQSPVTVWQLSGSSCPFVPLSRGERVAAWPLVWRLGKWPRLQLQTSQQSRPLILTLPGFGSALIGRRLSRGGGWPPFPSPHLPLVPCWQPPTLVVGVSLDRHSPRSVRACPGPPAAGDDVAGLCTWVQGPICSLSSRLSVLAGLTGSSGQGASAIWVQGSRPVPSVCRPAPSPGQGAKRVTPITVLCEGSRSKLIDHELGGS